MLDLLWDGGPFMVPLLFCSVVGLSVALDRWLYLREATRETDAVLGAVDARIEKGDVAGIAAYCANASGLLCAMFLGGIRKFEQLQDEPNLDFVQHEIAKKMEEASFINTTDLESRLPLLASVGNVAPLFGFAGTVTGMINAFSAIAATDNPSAQVVAGGIQEALITTAAGLVIAIPAVLFYNYFVARIDALNARTEESANGLIDMLVMAMVARRRQPAGAGA